MIVTRRSDLDFVDLPGRRAADPLREHMAASSVRAVQVHRDPTRTAHRHPYSEEVIYVVAGSGHIWTDGVRTRVGPGDVVLIEAGVAHATVPDAGVDMDLICFFPHPDLAANHEPTTTLVTDDNDERNPNE